MCLLWLHYGMANNRYYRLLLVLRFYVFILGFDAVTTLSNETKQPTKNIPRAVMLTTLAGGLIFFTAAWFIQLYFPNNVRFHHPSEALPEIVLYVGGALFQSIFLCGQIMNTVASGLASHASASRLLYIMGSDNIFPKSILEPSIAL